MSRANPICSTLATIEYSSGSSPRLWGTHVPGYGRRSPGRFIPTPVGNTLKERRAAIGGAVHPHACGEHLAEPVLDAEPVGSSPRLWGTRLVPPILGAKPRFIPTPVGNTWAQVANFNSPPVHPHACGEHGGKGCGRHGEDGSSPRLWGTLPGQLSPTDIFRFIPTPVGNTVSDLRSVGVKPVHPHACGEHFFPFFDLYYFFGSSPRLWGTLHCAPYPVTVGRFIPTPVGNTPLPWPRSSPLPVHPHACGEHSQGIQKLNLYPGSSPRLWGTRLAASATRLCQRFIPTPVGNTFLCPLFLPENPVHPHACGEHRTRRMIALLVAGSSPRLWGTRINLYNPSEIPRFIPTPVGNTTCTPGPNLAVPVHPHACGEHNRLICASVPTIGSSPRLWGTRRIWPSLSQRHRFIPTPVGNT